ncbi:MAG: DUF5677 domain-containing protein [Dokdonella sp.]
MNQYENWAVRSVQQWGDTYGLAERFMAEARSLINSGEIRQHEMLKIIRILLFGRILSGTHGIVMLSKAGLSTEADVLFRANMEALFRLAALVEDETMLDAYLGEDYPRRRKAMGDISKLLSTCNPRPDGSVTDADLDAALRKIDQEETAFLKSSKQKRLREISTWEWVKAGNQTDFFYGKYLLHSNTAHHGARDLERHLVKSADGQEVDSILLHPDTTSPVELLVDTLLLLSRAIDLYAKSIQVEIPTALWALRSELDVLFAATPRGTDSASNL